MEPRIDPQSPVPLYHQIAEAIRARIQAGDLRPGDALVPLREAARRWSVNLHTVRHAYTALAREGLVESRGARGTRVAPRPAGSADAGLEAFLARVVDEGHQRHGLDAHELAQELVAFRPTAAPSRPVVHVVECSENQAQHHARELEAAWDVEARPWSLDRHDEAPDGAVVATYFHYNDLRRLWPSRMRDIEFVTIGPDPTIAHRLEVLRAERPRLRVRVVELDLPTAENIAADVSTLLSAESFVLEPVEEAEPQQALADLADDEVAVFAPRSWSVLPATARAHPRALEARYAIERADLEALGSRFAWKRAADRAAPARATRNVQGGSR